MVISAAILSKSGKTLVARQFVEISRPRIEGLLASFPKLMSSDGKQRQHTYVETPSVRYVYQPMEDLYLLIITNKSSNILEDLDALHLLAKIVADYCVQLHEEDVLEAAFDLIFAFDECFAVGYKEKLTMRQIEENLEMDSHAERIHEIQVRQQHIDAEMQATESAARLERERKAGMRPISQLPSHTSQQYAPSYAPSKPAKTDEDDWGSSNNNSRVGSGMKLSVGSKGAKDDAFLMQVAKQDSTVKSSVRPSAGSSSSSGMSSSNDVEKKPIVFSLKETVSATLDKEGELAAVNIKGELNLFISAPEFAAIKVRLPNADPLFSFHTHPAVDKAAFKNGVLAPKDPDNAPFPVNSLVKVMIDGRRII